MGVTKYWTFSRYDTWCFIFSVTDHFTVLSTKSTSGHFVQTMFNLLWLSYGSESLLAILNVLKKFVTLHIEGFQPEWCISTIYIIVEIYHSSLKPSISSSVREMDWWTDPLCLLRLTVHYTDKGDICAVRLGLKGILLGDIYLWCVIHLRACWKKHLNKWLDYFFLVRAVDVQLLVCTLKAHWFVWCSDVVNVLDSFCGLALSPIMCMVFLAWVIIHGDCDEDSYWSEWQIN